MRGREVKTKVKVIFPAAEKGVPGWPYIDYDHEERARRIMQDLEESLPGIEFSGSLSYSIQESIQEAERAKGQYEGYLVCMTSAMVDALETPVIFCETCYPVIVADELYCGTGGFLKAYSSVNKEGLPVVFVASSNFKDIVDRVKLFPVMKKMRGSRILVVTDIDKRPASPRFGDSEKISEIFGTQIVTMSPEELDTYDIGTDAKAAEATKERWIKEALEVVEPTEEEVLRSARLYLALKRALEDKEADAVTVNCLGLWQPGHFELPAYPCLAHFQLNNEGLTGVCEGDLDSAVTQLLIRYLTGRPGYVSDPVIDTATNQIIYAHCVATNRVYGPHGPSNPYIIRSHSEDRKGASVQSLMPLGEIVTTVKVSSVDRALSIHQGKTLANVREEEGCRSKLAVEVPARKILENYNFDMFGWHRVTAYGDFRGEFVDLATLYGLKLYVEDE